MATKKDKIKIYMELKTIKNKPVKKKNIFK